MKLAWFAGVDWGSQKHQACVLDAVGKVLGERAFEHGGQGLAEMADWLLSFASGEAGEAGEVGVAIETPRGPVVESLMERGFAVHSMNPKQLDRFRDRFSPAGAKDDRRDARVLASALRTDPHCLRQLEPTDPKVIELREWSRLREDLTRERTRLANRMREQLWRYYPQFLAAIDDDVATPWALDLWRRLPTPTAAQRVREATLARVLKQHCIRRIDAATSGQRNRRLGPAARLVLEAVQPFSVKALRPLGHTRCAHAQARGDLLLPDAFAPQQNDVRPNAVTPRSRRGCDPTLQLLFLLGGHLKYRDRTCHSTLPPKRVTHTVLYINRVIGCLTSDR